LPTPKIPTDFNGFLGRDLLCLAHEAEPLDHEGEPVQLMAGAYVIAFDDDNVGDDGQIEFMVVSGIVERSPADAAHRGSVWSLRTDPRGVRYLSSLDDAD